MTDLKDMLELVNASNMKLLSKEMNLDPKKTSKTEMASAILKLSKRRSSVFQLDKDASMEKVRSD